MAMITLNAFNCTNCLSWIREQCETNKVDTVTFQPSVAIDVTPNPFQNNTSSVPTIFTEVQELTFDKSGNPNIIIVNSSRSSSEVDSTQLCSQENRWAFPARSESNVVDLQQSDDVDETTDEENCSSLTQVVETETQEWKPSSHFHKYIRMMHICGTAPLPKLCEPSYTGQKSWKWLCFIQRAFFWIVVGCAAFDLVCQSKLSLLNFLSGDGFNAFVNFAFCLISLGAAIWFAFLLCREVDMAKMVNFINKYEENDYYERWIPNAASCLGIFTTISAFALQIFSFGMWDESFLEIILHSSHSISQDLFLWNFKNMTNTDDQLFDQFFEKTATNIILGIILIIRDFLSNLYIRMVWDLILIVSLVLFCWRRVFIENHAMPVVNNVGPPDSFDARTLQTARENVFKKWQAYKIVYQFINIVFGPFLPLFHVTNVLMYAFFLSICILPDEKSSTVLYVSYLYDIVKTEVTYAIASRLTKQDEIIRKLIRNWGMRTGKITVDGEDWDLNGLLDELNSEPMVFGTGNFAINQRFHFGIIGLVGSLFVSLANGIGRISSGY